LRLACLHFLTSSRKHTSCCGCNLTRTDHERVTLMKFNAEITLTLNQRSHSSRPAAVRRGQTRRGACMHSLPALGVLA